MRIGIQEQLGLLVLFTSLLALAVIAISTWVNNYHFVVGIKSSGLELTASLKAAQIAAELVLIQTTCGTIATRILIQNALKRFYQGNNTDANWVNAAADVQSALASGGANSNLLQVKIFPRNATGNPHGLLNITATNIDSLVLPYLDANGSTITLGDGEAGYPSSLYPNLTYVKTNSSDPTGDVTTNLTEVYAFPDFILNTTSALLLGPLQINSSSALISITIPMINNTSAVDILGYMTIVAAATTLYGVTTSREGLDNTGVTLLLGPADATNRFTGGVGVATSSYKPNNIELGNSLVDYVFSPQPISEQTDRHSTHDFGANGMAFPLKDYPSALKAFAAQNPSTNNASSDLSTHNEEGIRVAVGYARPQSDLVDWLLIVEQSHKEAWAPILRLRNILLACVFGTAGAITLLVFPLAHYAVRPIRRLRDATEKSIQPPGYSPSGSIRSERLDDDDYISDNEHGDDEEVAQSNSQKSKKSSNKILVRLRNIRHRGRKTKAERMEDARRRVFKIPGKVQDRKHFITDELTELTGTFNEMSDELMMQYARLEERVAERTQELEISKKAAEAANESKTLFIANISHELKTPLNGILGMCAVCMGEDDLPKIKRSLQVVYKSGDLLLHLLNDLLTFSKNQIGQSLSLEEKEFRLSDIKSQIVTIFDKQVREGKINFGVLFLGTGDDWSPERERPTSLPALGPQGTGRMKDMCLWGDQHRILQVVINLVSNSLKFTPEGGKVEVRIKCIGESESHDASRKNSVGSKGGSQRPSRRRNRVGSNEGSQGSMHSNSMAQSTYGGRSSATSMKPGGTALLINPMDPKATPHIQVHERSQSLPPPNAKTLIFEFEVEDTGPGIPESMQQRVFEPFVQGDLGLSKKYGGTGLGLSICSQLATLMGGTITLTSTVGRGSTFNMRIPLKFVKERTASTASSSVQGSRPTSEYTIHNSDESVPRRSMEINPAAVINGTGTPKTFKKDTQPRLVGLSQPFFASPSTPSPGTSSKEQMEVINHMAATKDDGKVRVLVAEDNLVNQEVVLRMLKLEDIYDVVIAKDGQEAYDMVKESMNNGLLFNLIFMDIQMPNLDGLQSTRLIRQMGYSAPIVALTAFAEESNVKECMDSGMDMFLSKPIRRPALKQVLKKFATIPEEVETNTLSRKSTPEKKVAIPGAAASTEAASTPTTRSMAA